MYNRSCSLAMQIDNWRDRSVGDTYITEQQQQNNMRLDNSDDRFG